MTEPWRCSECETLLGYVEDKRIVRIKRKDLFIEIEGGRVSRPCTKCGKINTLVDSNFGKTQGQIELKEERR